MDRMKHALLAALLLIQSQSGVPPQTSTGSQMSSAALYPRFHPKVSGPFSLDINQPFREAYETIAARAGVSIVFDRDFRVSTTPMTLKVNDVDIFQALDRMAQATNTFWVPIGTRTIFVLDNNVTKHRDYDLYRVEVIELTGAKAPQELNNVMSAVRQGLNMTSMISFPKTNSLVIKDSAAKVALAEKFIADLETQLNGAPTTVVPAVVLESQIYDYYAWDASGRDINPISSQLQPTSSGLSSFDFNNQPYRTAFETIAARAGFSVIFNRDLTPLTQSTITLKWEDVDVYEALRIVSIATRTFWVPVGDHTIFITSDNTTTHRDYDPMTLDVIHLTGAKPPQEVNDVMNAVRQMLNITTMTANPGTNTLMLKDAPGRVALAERLIPVLDGPVNGASSASNTAIPAAAYQMDATGNVYVLDGSRRNINPVRSKLQPTSTGSFSFDLNSFGLNAPGRTAFETIAARAGLSVVFDRDYGQAPVTTMLTMNNVDIYMALDLMALSLHNFWVPIDSKTIFVSDNNTTKRRDFEPLLLEVIDITGLRTAQELNDVMNGVRQNLNMTSILAHPWTNSLVIRDTPAKVALAERVIADLQTFMSGANPGAVASVVPVLSIETESLGGSVNTPNAGLARYRTSDKPQLQSTTTRPFSLRMNEDARHAYEILGETAGLNVTFDPQFMPGQTTAFRFDNVDILQALEQVGTQTGNFWQFVDGRTIRVAPGNSPNGIMYEPPIQKAFQLSNSASQDVIFIFNAVRSALNLRDSTSDPATRTINVRDTATKLKLVEKIITALDRPLPAK